MPKCERKKPAAPPSYGYPPAAGYDGQDWPSRAVRKEEHTMTETPSKEALEAARQAVEALPSHLFDRSNTEAIAQSLAPDFDAFAAQERERLEDPPHAVIARGVKVFLSTRSGPDEILVHDIWQAMLDELRALAEPSR